MTRKLAAAFAAISLTAHAAGAPPETASSKSEISEIQREIGAREKIGQGIDGVFWGAAAIHALSAIWFLGTFYGIVGGAKGALVATGVSGLAVLAPLALEIHNGARLFGLRKRLRDAREALPAPEDPLEAELKEVRHKIDSERVFREKSGIWGDSGLSLALLWAPLASFVILTSGSHPVEKARRLPGERPGGNRPGRSGGTHLRRGKDRGVEGRPRPRGAPGEGEGAGGHDPAEAAGTLSHPPAGAASPPIIDRKIPSMSPVSGVWISTTGRMAATSATRHRAGMITSARSGPRSNLSIRSL